MLQLLEYCPALGGVTCPLKEQIHKLWVLQDLQLLNSQVVSVAGGRGFAQLCLVHQLQPCRLGHGDSCHCDIEVRFL